MHTYVTMRALRLLARTRPPGDVVEFGVYKGGGLLLLNKGVREAGMSCRLFGFDTFAGMPPSEVAAGDDCDDVRREGSFADTSLESVRQRMEKNGIDSENIQSKLPRRLVRFLEEIKRLSDEAVKANRSGS